MNIFLGPWGPFKPLEQNRKKRGRRGGKGHTPRPKLATESLSPLCYSHWPTVRWGKLLLAIFAYLGHSSETESIRFVPPSRGSTEPLSIDEGSWPKDMETSSTAMSSGQGSEAWGKSAVPDLRTRFVWADRSTAKVEEEGSPETARADASNESGVV